MTETLKKEQIPSIPVLKDIKKTVLVESDQKFSVHAKAQKDLPEISGNTLLDFSSLSSELFLIV